MIRSVASINQPPSIQRHIKRIERLRLAMKRAKTEERKVSLQAELDQRVGVLQELKKQINEGI